VILGGYIYTDILRVTTPLMITWFVYQSIIQLISVIWGLVNTPKTSKKMVTVFFTLQRCRLICAHVGAFCQEFADGHSYEVRRRSVKEQLLGIESRIPAHTAVFYVGQSPRHATLIPIALSYLAPAYLALNCDCTQPRHVKNRRRWRRFYIDINDIIGPLRGSSFTWNRFNISGGQIL